MREVMRYDVDNDYAFETKDGFNVLPSGMRRDGDLLVLPNGKYLPHGAYIEGDGSVLIYEPRQLSPFADMIASFRK